MPAPPDKHRGEPHVHGRQGRRVLDPHRASHARAPALPRSPSALRAVLRRARGRHRGPAPHHVVEQRPDPRLGRRARHRAARGRHQGPDARRRRRLPQLGGRRAERPHLHHRPGRHPADRPDPGLTGRGAPPCPSP
ncbi:hypothetical protein NOCARDAX2BIS_590014 [Nocardioides sp. AX2bis]|nr:hypothetical protein NOCARDAX2BIS_590014 [Nocardioides sp. AX2bis]